MTPTPTIDTAVRILNEALRDDRAAITALAAHREPCTFQLEAHPTIQVIRPEHADGRRGGAEVGLLGILNGVLEAMTGQRVAAVYDDSGSKVVEFRVYTPSQEASQ